MNTKNISVRMIASIILIFSALIANHIAVRSERNPICDVTTYEGGQFPSYCLPPQLELSLLPSSVRRSDQKDFAKADIYTIFVDIAILSLGYISIRQKTKTS